MHAGDEIDEVGIDGDLGYLVAQKGEEAARLLSDAKAQIETEKQNAIREIRGQVAELSVQIAEKVLKAKLSDDKAQMDMINRLLDEVSSDNK